MNGHERSTIMRIEEPNSCVMWAIREDNIVGMLIVQFLHNKCLLVTVHDHEVATFSYAGHMCLLPGQATPVELVAASSTFVMDVFCRK